MASSKDRTRAYAEAVHSGALVAAPLVRLAAARHLRDLDRDDLVFNEDAAAYAIAFFERFLWLVDVDKPFLLVPWHAFIVGSLFGWHLPTADGERPLRRFRTAYIEVGKGNGKSPIAAGIGTFGLLADKEPAAEIYAAAVTRKQAKIMFGDAKKMVSASPALAGRVDVHENSLAVPETYSFFHPLSAEARALDGLRVHMGLLDEVHEHPTPLVVEKLRAGTKGRRNALIVEITNSGYDRTSICWRHHEYSERVLDGTLDNDTWFAFVCGLDKDDDPLTDPTCWIKANPNLGVSVTERYLAERVHEARGLPASESLVRRLNFCQWTQSATRFFSVAHWQACPAGPSIETLPPRTPVYAGLDLGADDDLSAFVLIWWTPEGLVIKPWVWVAEAALARDVTRPYEVWQRSGDLHVTAGEVVDFDVVEETVIRECRAAGCRMLGYDPHQAEQMRQHCEAAGLTMVKCPQGFALSEALTWLSAAAMKGHLFHRDHPVLAWMAANMVTQVDHRGHVKPAKPAPGAKIDGIVALAMAVTVGLRDPRRARGASVYARRGALVVG